MPKNKTYRCKNTTFFCILAPLVSFLQISGTTVNDHITSLLYKEICNLLKQSDLTMGEIADYLHFNDQSALTNFFKTRAGMTPLAYRNQYN
jgi:AraC family transcriptional regulator, transcriptional activator of pobA